MFITSGVRRLPCEPSARVRIRSRTLRKSSEYSIAPRSSWRDCRSTYGQTRAMYLGTTLHSWLRDQVGFAAIHRVGYGRSQTGLDLITYSLETIVTGPSFGAELADLEQPAFYSIAFRQAGLTTNVDHDRVGRLKSPGTRYRGRSTNSAFGIEATTYRRLCGIATGNGRYWSPAAGDWTQPDHIQISKFERSAGRSRAATRISGADYWPLWPSTV